MSVHPDPDSHSDSHPDTDALTGLAPALTAGVPAILREVADLLKADHPDYARFITEQFDEIVAGAELLMLRLVSAVHQDRGELASPAELAMFEEIGRTQFRENRGVTSLLSAYRIGARVAWRHVTEAALAHGIHASLLASLGSMVFAAVDELSAASLRGFLAEHSATASTRERFRDELAELLLSGSATMAGIKATAARARWPVPKETAVVLAAPDNEVARVLLNFDGDACLRLCKGDMLVAIVPDPDGPGRRELLRTTLRGANTVVGPATPVDGLATSLSIARTAARLRHTGLIAGDPLFADEHLDALIVHQDDRLLAALRRRYLAPLAGLPRPARERLQDTLCSWLRNLGDGKAMAAELHIHPQTVRYRMRQVRERFGDSLADPKVREALALALEWGPGVCDEDGDGYEPPNRDAKPR